MIKKLKPKYIFVKGNQSEIFQKESFVFYNDNSFKFSNICKLFLLPSFNESIFIWLIGNMKKIRKRILHLN